MSTPDIDVTPTLAPNSDQLGGDDFMASPATVTITGVSKGTKDQPIDVHVAEFERPWKPAKSVRRILAQAWGTHTSGWIGQRATLYRDPHVLWAGEEVGGIRVSALSGIDKPMQVSLTVKRGKRTKVTVQPLPDAPASPDVPSLEQVAECTDPAQLRVWWKSADPQLRKVIEARVEELKHPAQQVDEQTGEVQDAFPEPAAPAAGADPWAEGGAK